MKNLYAIQCDLYPMTKIIEVLKSNNFDFYPDSQKPTNGSAKHLSFDENKMCFTKRIVILEKDDLEIVVGNTYREGINDSAFQIYFPNQAIKEGFNYNPEFSKALITMDLFNFSDPVIAINLNKMNIRQVINEANVTFSNVQTRSSRKFKPADFKKSKNKGIEKLFLYKNGDFFIVIGWILQGKKNKNTVIYNKSFTEFLMTIPSVDLKTPKEFDQTMSNTKDHKEKVEFGSKPIPRQNLNDNRQISTLGNKSKLWVDQTPNINKINRILEKINKSGLASLSIQELTFLKNSSRAFAFKNF